MGLLVMSMGKGQNVRKGERVTAYEPTREVVMRGCKPFRTIVANFSVLPGKYSVIPLVQNFGDPAASRFSLRLYFNCEPDKIGFHSDEKPIRVLEYLQ